MEPGLTSSYSGGGTGREMNENSLEQEVPYSSYNKHKL